MASLEARIEQAKNIWIEGLSCEQAGELQLAYTYYTEAHNLIMDCAKHHQKSHMHLRRINFKLGNYSELVTDWLLHLFSPLGVFEMVSYFSKTEAFGNDICKRKA